MSHYKNTFLMIGFTFFLLSLLLLFLACSGEKKRVGAEKIKVSAMHFEWGSAKPTYRDRENLSNQQHKDVLLKIIFVPSENYVTKLLANFAGGISPDILFSMTGRHRLLIRKGVFQPLDDFIHSAGGIDLKEFNEIILREQLTYEGKIYALPFSVTSLALLYNKDLFSEAGIPPLSETEPITWDEFREIAVKLTRDTNQDGVIDQYGCVPGFDNVQPTYFFYVLNETFGGRAYNPEEGEAYFDSEPTIEAFRFLHSLIHKYRCAPTPALAQQLGGQLFFNKRLGLWVNGPWVELEIQEKLPTLCKKGVLL